MKASQGSSTNDKSNRNAPIQNLFAKSNPANASDRAKAPSYSQSQSQKYSHIYDSYKAGAQ